MSFTKGTNLGTDTAEGTRSIGPLVYITRALEDLFFPVIVGEPETREAKVSRPENGSSAAQYRLTWSPLRADQPLRSLSEDHWIGGALQ